MVWSWLRYAQTGYSAQYHPIRKPPQNFSLLTNILSGKLPACPDLYIGVVDVRDLVELHFRAMLDPKAAGERFVATADGNSLTIKDFALVLKKNLSEGEGGKISTRSMPDFLLKIMGYLDKNAGSAVPELGKRHLGSDAKAKEVLGWKPRGAEEAIIASVKGLKEFGVV